MRSPIRLSPSSEPQPDLTLLRNRPDFYAHGGAGLADVLLLVEVSDSSLNYDRGVKLQLYAEAGIPEAWIINLIDDCIEVSREPSGGQYRQHEVLRRGAVLSPQAMPDVVIAVAAVL